MARYHFRIVNVFAESTFGGNPLCVFEDATGMDESTMQALARQFNLSETTFLLPSDVADAQVRVFTTGYEMRFAGHPTLGSAHVLRAISGGRDRLTLAFKAGLVPVSAQGDRWTLVAPTAGAPLIRPTGLPDAAVAAMVGLDADDLAASPVWVDTGADQLLVPVKSVEAVRRAAPPSSLLPDWPLSTIGRRCAYVFAFDEAQPDVQQVEARYFFAMHGSGVFEDPGTGSACANLGGWLIANAAPLPARIAVRQGDAIDRPCRLSLEVSPDLAIRVGGRVVEIGRGSIDI
ncbi:MAG: PhzF family phenazine biosynthesis protein [Herminiimonas sp.]|nr:PhzF family phenazine biosynthesis protein [Herminiimonas sp.]